MFQETTYDDRALTRYLLGQLAGEEADRLDELAIVDDEVAWRVREIENDLVDAYVRRMLDDTKNYGELETGGTRLAFAANELVRNMIPVNVEQSGPHKPAPPFELAMVIDDVDSGFRQALAAGAVEVKSPEKKPWGQIVGHVRDRNGFLIEICSPVP